MTKPAQSCGSKLSLFSWNYIRDWPVLEAHPPPPSPRVLVFCFRFLVPLATDFWKPEVVLRWWTLEPLGSARFSLSLVIHQKLSFLFFLFLAGWQAPRTQSFLVFSLQFNKYLWYQQINLASRRGRCIVRETEEKWFGILPGIYPSVLLRQSAVTTLLYLFKIGLKDRSHSLKFSISWFFFLSTSVTWWFEHGVPILNKNN